MPRKPKPAKYRTLVGEILMTQLAFALIVGGVALVSLWSATNWVVRVNLDEWSAQWVADLDALGAGLFHQTGDERYLAIEGYVAKFPEIAFVRYYNPDGDVVHLESRYETGESMPLLSAADLAALTEAADRDDHHLITRDQDSPTMQISAAVVTRKFGGDLLAAQSFDELPVEVTLQGFVQLGLDYSDYENQLSANVLEVGALVALTFLVLGLAGRVHLRKALQPLADIQNPLSRLAEGESDFQIEPSRYKEIAEITDGLNSAIARVHERDEHLKYLAHHDALTGLLNRHSFLEMLHGMVGRQDKPAGVVMFIDLDQFKYVNDTLGHLAGDAVLQQAAARIARSVRHAGDIARFGGDEFGVVIEGIDKSSGLERAERIMADLTEFPFLQGGQSFSLTCSIGLVSLDEVGDLGDLDLLAFADLACQHAKNDGRNRVHVFQPEAGVVEEIKRDVGWSQKIQQGLKADSFTLYYQPIVEAASGVICHYEVLLRLVEGDIVHGPDAFLPAAERFGLMSLIDRWVITQAFEKLAWLRRKNPELRFTINVSGGAFKDGDFVGFVKSQLQANKLAPGAVIFEITEQVAVGSLVGATSQIRELIEVGCEFALDDFGTGYSSFTYLKRLPMQYIKIDGQFIAHLDTNPADQIMVKAISDLAKLMGKKTIAEYVENAGTLQLLVELGIDFAQGYHIGKPASSLQAATPSGKPQLLRAEPKS